MQREGRSSWGNPVSEDGGETGIARVLLWAAGGAIAAFFLPLLASFLEYKCFGSTHVEDAFRVTVESCVL